MMTNALNEIKIMIRARYPIIYVISWEENRVINKIIRNYKNDRKVYLWSLSRGMKEINNSKNSGKLLDPYKALLFIRENSENAIFILTNFHHYFKKRDPLIISLLHELNMDLKKSMKNVILISPFLEIPTELEKDIFVVDFPLPNEYEINRIFKKIKLNLKSHKNLDLNLSTASEEHLIKTLRGLTKNEIENVLYKSIVEKNKFSIDVVIEEKEQIIKKSGILEYFHTNESVDQVGGLNNLKVWAKKRKFSFVNKARDFGLPYPKGLLLIGVQGCGKSLSCKAIANLWKFPLIRLDVGAIFQGIVGSSEKNIRKAIKLAESIAPCVLWIDEIEKGFSGIQSSSRSDAGTAARVFGTFLTWMQEKEIPVFVVATANDINQLPPEFLRKGRFDEIFFVDLPNKNERQEIFKIHIQKRNRDPKNFDLELLARKSEKFNGAEIESSIISALYDAYEENLKDKTRKLETEDILNNLHKIVPLSVTLKEKINSMRLWAKKRARRANISEEKSEDYKLVI